MSGRLVVRTLGAAGVGALLGIAYWLEHQLWPWEPILDGSLSSCAGIGAVVGCALALGFSAFGIEIPFFPSRWSRRQNDTAFWKATGAGATTSSADRSFGSTLYDASATRTESPKAEVRWISPEKYKRWSVQLKQIQIRLGLSLLISLLTLTGILARIFIAGSAGFFGDPSSANIFFYLALAIDAVLLYMGGMVWRILALLLAAGTLYVLLGP